MKFMSYTCSILDTHEKIVWLTDVVGVTIFKTVEIQQVPHQTTDSLERIIFYVPDKEFEMKIKLTYPPGTFEEHMT